MARTLLHALKKNNNDYSKAELKFFNSTGFELLSTGSFPVCFKLSVSVIIPAFNANNTIEFVLSSLKEQTFLKHGGKLEIIIVDDASPVPILTKILKFEKELNIKYLRKSKNRGAGEARDEALRLAKNNLLIFVDSDIVLPKNFISNHVFAQSFLSTDSVLVSFRENIKPNDKRVNNLNAWENARLDQGDHRNRIIFKKQWVMQESDKKLIGKEFDVLRHSHFFKKFKDNKKIDLWNLPMMVLTCVVSVKKDLIKSKYSTPIKLNGWGFNDTCLFAPVIAKGAYVIPLLNSNVLHLIENRHTKKDALKNSEFLRNKKIYLRFVKNTVL